VVDVAKEWYYGGIGDLAAGVTFWILLTVPAAALALVSALGWLGAIVGTSLATEVQSDVSGFLERLFSTNSQRFANFVDELFSQQSGGLLTVSLALAFWTISRGFAGLIRALDGVYDVEEGRAWYHTRVVALILGLGTLIVAAPIVLLEVLFWSRYAIPFEATLRSLVSVAILVLWASTIYHFGPAVRTKWKWDLPGAVVAAVMWWLLTLGYGYYVDLSSAGSDVVGTIGAFILALTWIWLAAQVLLIGAVVNSLLGDRLGINRAKRSWKINERIFRTGEMKRIDVDLEPPIPTGDGWAE
jgi:membrane protein